MTQKDLEKSIDSSSRVSEVFSRKRTLTLVMIKKLNRNLNIPEVAHVCAWYGLNDELTNVFLKAYYAREPTNKELKTLKKLKTQILLEFAWIDLSTLKTDLDQETWDKYYDQASSKAVEELSLIQMISETKPSDEIQETSFWG